MRRIQVRATWDAEAGVWVATSDDVPGLATEATGLDLLKAKLDVMIPELLAANGSLPGESSLSIELLVEYREKVTSIGA